MKAKSILLAVLVTLSMTVAAYAGPVYMDSGGGSGTASPAGDSGSIQYNAAGTLNGAEQILVNVNSSGTTSFFGMTNAGATIWAMNWQGYDMVEYINGLTDYVKTSAGSTKYWTNGTTLKEVTTTAGITRYFVGGTVEEVVASAGSTKYFSGGAIQELKTASGTTHYDLAGNVFWSDISGFYISEISAPSANITMKTAVFDTTRSGVSATSSNQVQSGSTLIANSAWGTIMWIYSAAMTSLRLPPIASGSTEYLKVVNMGAGVSVGASKNERFFKAGEVGAGASALYIPAGSYLHDMTLFAVTGYQVGGVTSFWYYTASSGVSGL